jgi:hypothetical protein
VQLCQQIFISKHYNRLLPFMKQPFVVADGTKKLTEAKLVELKTFNQ